MTRERGLRWRFPGVAAVAVVALATMGLARAVGSAEPCCFNNDAYGGMCTVVPDQGETCQGILAYLNNPMSTGKSYCGGTTVRGGWARVNCSTGKPMASENAAPSAADARKPAPQSRAAAPR